MASSSSRRPIFVAATRQHVGKTTCSLALMSGLKKRFNRVGFIKPVGQQHVTVAEVAPPHQNVRVDKDVQLLKEYFKTVGSYKDMSPVIIPRGYTQDYVDGKVTCEEQAEAIRTSYGRIAAEADVVLLEGTGHVGVGSIVEMSNSRVASMLDADMVLVCNGGLGSAFDELEMNRVMCEAHGVRVRGVILNKVLPDKVEMVRDYFGRVMEQRWGLPLLGVVPDLPFLSKCSLGDMCTLLGAEMISGEQYRPMHYSADDVEVVTVGLRRYLRKQLEGARSGTRQRPLFITHCTRDDVVLGYLSSFHSTFIQLLRGETEAALGRKSGFMKSEVGQARATHGRGLYTGALILCEGASGDVDLDKLAGDTGNHLSPSLRTLCESYDAPVLLATGASTEVAEVIKRHTAKLSINDNERVAAAIDHYEPHIDFDKLLE